MSYQVTPQQQQQQQQQLVTPALCDGELVQEGCEAQYGETDQPQRLSLAHERL